MTFKNMFFAILILGVLLFTLLTLVSIVKAPHDQAPGVQAPAVVKPPVMTPPVTTPLDTPPSVKAPPRTVPEQAPGDMPAPDQPASDQSSSNQSPALQTPTVPEPRVKETRRTTTRRPVLDGEAIPYTVWNTTRLPGEKLGLQLPTGFSAEFDGRPVTPDTRVPSKPGTQILKIYKPDGSSLSRVSVFTLEPLKALDDKGWLNGYRIGTYPQNPPRGFIRLDSVRDKNIEISPHFKLGQFLCKQQPEAWPKYVLVTQANLKRLETLRESLVKDQITDAQTFFVMSGFRTPFYNTAIGSAKLSRHMYGDAADIYIDVNPRDGNMDDLNRDGAVNKSDANYLYDYASKLYAENEKVHPGGLGAYKANAVHGPFVHVDGRGHVARWGR